MTNIDIDGIRNDIKAHLGELPVDVVDCVGCHIAVTDVPALLDLLAERDAEIQRLRAVAEAAQQHACALAFEGDPSEVHPSVTEKALLETVRAYAGGHPAEPQYLIWSQHHKAWWGPQCSGYRSHIADAGRYTLDAANRELRRGCGCCLTPEVVVPAPPAGLHGAALQRYAESEIDRATDARIRAGEVNRYAQVEQFNDAYPVGTIVRYWTGVREGAGRVGTTKTKAQVLGGHTAVVWVTETSSAIALSHIEVVEDPATEPIGCEREATR